jgi:hypothetical protein
MGAMQRYRLRTFPCNTADMTRHLVSILFPNRIGSLFVSLHSLSCPSIRLIRLIRLFFFLPDNRTGAPQAAGNLPGEIKSCWRADFRHFGAQIVSVLRS